MRENPQQRFQLMGMSQQCERTIWDLQVPEFGLQVFRPGAQFNQHKEKWSETGKRITNNPESQLLRVVDIFQWQYHSVQCSGHPSLDMEQNISHQTAANKHERKQRVDCQWLGYFIQVRKMSCLTPREWQPTSVFLPGKLQETETPGRLQSMGLQRVIYNWACMHVHTPRILCVFITQQI